MTNPQSSGDLDGVAIIGMAGRFPGAASIDELWRNVCNSAESITFFSDEELDPSIEDTIKNDPDYVKARGIVEDIDKVDAAFFGLSPREAEIMDPQQRVFLEVAWAALENAGYEPGSFDGLIGVYAGNGPNSYFANNISGNRELIENVGWIQMLLANEKDFLATRVSHKMNLTGPSVSVNTACSTSLVAICHAFQSLMTYQCDMALAGGISIWIPQNSGYLYQEDSILSIDGHCRPFDARAQGTTFNSGVGIVVLKRIQDALADNDNIYAIIRGAALNNDGSKKVSFAAPSVEGQAKVIATAIAQANVPPETISYIEAHGTATQLGDPIEIEALTEVFRSKTLKKKFCAIGSIKGNIGHLLHAAGVAGLISTALALKHKLLPPLIHFEKANPEIDFENSPFYVNTNLSEWIADTTPRRALVNSFGMGGTNAHVVLEEAPAVEPSGLSRPSQLLLLSAKTNSALNTATSNLGEHLKLHPDVNLADVAYTLQRGRKAFNHRSIVVCSDVQDTVQCLKSLDPNRVVTRHLESRDPAVVFMFPGQGTQYVNMGLTLYKHEPVFTEAVAKCSKLLEPLIGRDLRQVLYPSGHNFEAAGMSLRNTYYTQPALFTTEYALAKLWESWGLHPKAMIGHSIGEFVCACLAEVFSLEDALMLIATRGRLMQDLSGGRMLSVRLPAVKVRDRLNSELAIAAINGPSLCVVSGPTKTVCTLQNELESEGIICKHLHTSHAFHSPMIDPIIEPFAETLSEVELSAPQIPFVSTVSADWITPEQAKDPMYWARHMRETVRFAEGVQELWKEPDRVLLEVGPGTTAATLARQQAKDNKKQVAISSLFKTVPDQTEWFGLLNALGKLWLVGVPIDWSNFHANEIRHRVALPTYPFEQKRFWIETASAVPVSKVVERRPEFKQQEVGGMSKSQVNTTQELRKESFIPLLKDVLQDVSGMDMASADTTTTFLEMGFDSLSLTQVSLMLKKKFGLEIKFRHLLEEYSTLDSLAEFIEQESPSEPLPADVPPQEPIPEAPPPHLALPSIVSGDDELLSTLSQPVQDGTIEQVIALQLQVMSQQLEMLTNGAPSSTPQGGPTKIDQGTKLQNRTPAPFIPNNATRAASPPIPSSDSKKSFGVMARIDTTWGEELTPLQRAHLKEFIERYVRRTAESKRFAQNNRARMADPRVVTGFRPLWKEIVYPIVVERSSGSKLWDIDGNEYVDLLCGFGSNFLGYLPPFIIKAVEGQLKRGFQIGPQHLLAAQVAELMCEFTGLERVAFCNTGSEAVMGAMRIARTITGRSKIAIFSGSYHGTLDEVVVRKGTNLQSVPAAPGILPSSVENLLVLDYDSLESLEILKACAGELAAVMVEPVQSRRPDCQPRKFLHDLRELTELSGSALIFDEIITGFRIRQGGAQEYFGVKADMATYGKIIGGGLPLAAIAGKAEFMDALDGGFWQFGDTSVPEVGVTFFAGTFVRHPLALAAAKAVLGHLKTSGPDLQQKLNEKTVELVDELNAHFERVQAPIKLTHFGSLFRVTISENIPYGGLLFYLLREKGVHIWDVWNSFLTTAHSENDIALIVEAFKSSVAEMQDAGFLPQLSGHPILRQNRHVKGRRDGAEVSYRTVPRSPPLPGAKLGRDPNGNSAWFVPDLGRPGKYLQVETGK